MFEIEANRTALLVMDFQTEIVGLIGAKAAPLMERVAGLIAAARRTKLTIIYVVVGFRPGYPELSPRSQAFATVARAGRLATTHPEIAAPVRPEPNDPVVLKHRVSAFAGTALEQILRAQGIDTLLLCGISTSGVVLSTVRHGADADYRLAVVEDGCADADDEVHRVLTEKVLARQATIVTAAELGETLRALA